MKIAREDIYAITQAILAIIIVIGGGIAFFVKPELKEIVIGIMGVIVGYYFTGFINTPVRNIPIQSEVKND